MIKIWVFVIHYFRWGRGYVRYYSFGLHLFSSSCSSLLPNKLGNQKKLFDNVLIEYINSVFIKMFYTSSASIYRENCTADASVVPMLLLPTGIMGIFTSVFAWLYVTFLWSEDAYDPLKYLTYVAGVVTGLLQFVSEYRKPSDCRIYEKKPLWLCAVTIYIFKTTIRK